MEGFFGPDLNLYAELCEEAATLGRDIKRCNLEQLLVDLDISRRRLGSWDRSFKALVRDKYAYAYNSCLDYIQRRLHITDETADPLHIELFKSLEPGESVLTLNYDLVADQALTEVEHDGKGRLPPTSRMGKIRGLVGLEQYLGGIQPPGLLTQEWIGGLYLKLHGSLDWMRCTTRGCFGSISYFPSGQSELGKEHAHWTPCRYCGQSLEPAIIPPSTGKLIDDTGKSSFLWNLGWGSLHWADEWVIVGVSLAPSDFELRWMLRSCAFWSSGLRRITVVNPDDRAVKAVEEILPPKKSIEISRFADLPAYVASTGACRGNVPPKSVH